MDNVVPLTIKQIFATLALAAIILTATLFIGIQIGSQNVSAVPTGTDTAALPIAKGGTGSSLATGAATNILGTNFANYAGVLPVAKGGTGATSNAVALDNIAGANRFTYDLPVVTFENNLPNNWLNVYFDLTSTPTGQTFRGSFRISSTGTPTFQSAIAETNKQIPDVNKSIKIGVTSAKKLYIQFSNIDDGDGYSGTIIVRDNISSNPISLGASSHSSTLPTFSQKIESNDYSMYKQRGSILPETVNSCDFNNYKSTGVYYFDVSGCFSTGGWSLINAPVSNYGFLEVFAYDSTDNSLDRVMQRFTGDGRTSHIRYYNGGWGSWVQL
jgi:hypothetical protein